MDFVWWSNRFESIFLAFKVISKRATEKYILLLLLLKFINIIIIFVLCYSEQQ